MKTVWVLWYREYDDAEVVGVYKTKRRAQQMIPLVVRHGAAHRNKRSFEIEKHKLDGWPLLPEQKKTLKLPRWVK